MKGKGISAKEKIYIKHAIYLGQRITSARILKGIPQGMRIKVKGLCGYLERVLRNENLKEFRYKTFTGSNKI